MSRVLQEHDYIGLSEISSIQKTSAKPKSIVTNNPSSLSENPRKRLTLKATELRLGLPGSEFPVRVLEKVENGVSFPLGAKRGFSEANNGGFNNWGLPKNGGSEMGSLKKDASGQRIPTDQAPSKAQVVGWPPIRSFRKNSMAVNITKDNKDKDYGKTEPGRLYIKVSMDGAPYLRKLDLKTCSTYVGLSSALEKMFTCFTIGELGNQGVSGQDELGKGRLADDLQLSEYVVTYEDKEGDWMLVGDVPWNMFMDSCRRLRIIKSSQAVGLGSKATAEK